MFYCTPCGAERGWPTETGHTSQGPCEICGKVAVCHDVPSVRLPIPGLDRVGAEVTIDARGDRKITTDYGHLEIVGDLDSNGQPVALLYMHTLYDTDAETFEIPGLDLKLRIQEYTVRASAPLNREQVEALHDALLHATRPLEDRDE